MLTEPREISFFVEKGNENELVFKLRSKPEMELKYEMKKKMTPPPQIFPMESSSKRGKFELAKCQFQLLTRVGNQFGKQRAAVHTPTVGSNK